jgi:hypothetical protein
MSTLSLRLPESIHRKLAEVAEREGISINQYLAERAARGTERKFEAVLVKSTRYSARPRG